MKVALVSNSPWAGSGYGVQAAHLLPRLLARYGKDSTACLSLYGLTGGPLKIDGIQHYPCSGYTPYSDEILPSHARHWLNGEPGMVLVLFDVWIFQNPDWATLPLLAAWTPIDHVPPPPAVVEFFRRTSAVPIAMSKFGRDWLAKRNLDPLYVPHGVETQIMRPTPTFKGKPSRSLFGIDEDRYVVGMVSANKGVYPNRKSFAESMQAFAMWLDDPGTDRKPLLYIHADPTPNGGFGVDLVKTAEACGLKVGVDVDFSDPYVHRMPFSTEAMAALYSSFDVLLQPSMGEGFGVPAIEAQACGVPVIGSDFTAQPEVIEAGWVVSGDPFFDYVQNAWLVRPRPEGIAQALSLCAKRSPDEVAEMAGVALTHAAEYDVDRVWSEHWEPALDALEARVPTREPVKVAAGWSR